jgi:hypothetical protein
MGNTLTVRVSRVGDEDIVENAIQDWEQRMANDPDRQMLL